MAIADAARPGQRRSARLAGRKPVRRNEIGQLVPSKTWSCRPAGHIRRFLGAAVDRQGATGSSNERHGIPDRLSG